MGAIQDAAKEMADLERSHEQAINERDAAEECLSQMYFLVTGRSPEWSNIFGHAEALEDVGDAMVALKAAVPVPEPASNPNTGEWHG